MPDLITPLQAVIFQASRWRLEDLPPEIEGSRDTLHAAYSIEALDDDLVECFQITGKLPHGINPMREAFIRSKRAFVWVARLKMSDNGRLDREFVRGYKDFTRANSRGSRGIYYHFALPASIYETNEPVKYCKSTRRFLRVEQGKWTEISREEALKCLQNKD